MRGRLTGGFRMCRRGRLVFSGVTSWSGGNLRRCSGRRKGKLDSQRIALDAWCGLWHVLNQLERSKRVQQQNKSRNDEKRQATLFK